MESHSDEMDSFIMPVANAPLPRWQRKALESNNRTSSSTSNSECIPATTTPKSSRRPKIPNNDRFIPNRSAMDLDVSRHKLCWDGKENGQDPSAPYPSIVSASLLDKPLPTFSADGTRRPSSDMTHSKILAFSDKVPAVKEGYLNANRVLFSQSNGGAGGRRHKFRHIPQKAEKILDAPNMVDDFYLNLMDWGADNVLAVALADAVYLWNAQTGEIDELCRLECDNDVYTALKWTDDGSYLAVSSSCEDVQIWDARSSRLLRTMRGHRSRVGALAWNGHLLTSGARDGELMNHDVRVAQHVTATLIGHSEEVCGLAWNEDGRQLASGSNDNTVCVWDAQGQGSERWQPRLQLLEHTAAVKALAWCPWQNNLLATGGGTADRYLRFWNSANGVCVNAVDTKSQVCTIIWSPAEKELVTSHGFSQNQLTIWKYPSLARMAELKGHQSRVLHTSLSPDGQSVASLAGDETLRLWKIFATADTSGTSRAGGVNGKGCLSSSNVRSVNIR